MRRAAEILSGLVDDGSGVHATRWKSLMWGAESLVRGGCLSLTGIGRSGGSTALPKHNIKRADRLLKNERLLADHGVIFGHLASTVVGEARRFPVLIDWTKLTDGFRALVASVPHTGRSLPVFLEVHPESAHGSPQVEEDFMVKLRGVLPEGCRPILVTDAGFRSDWILAAQRHGFDYVARLAGYVQVETDVETDEWRRVQDLADAAEQSPTDLGTRRIARTRRDSPASRVVRGKRYVKKASATRKKRKGQSGSKKKAKKAATSSWVLATSLQAPASEVIELYSLRMQCEETFRDQKNPRFGWSLRFARSNSATRLANLLLVAALAALLLTLIGGLAERTGLHHRFKANTVNRRVLSLFNMARALLATPLRRVASPRRITEQLHRLQAHITTFPVCGDA